MRIRRVVLKYGGRGRREGEIGSARILVKYEDGDLG
jgi:hypothetical protein